MRAGGLLRLCAVWAGALGASDRAQAEDVDAASPFKDRQLRILGAMQRPWDLRTFYGSSIGAGSFVPLSQPFLGAMGPQHPADELHPASDDGRPSPFRTIMVACWELRRNGAGQPIAAPADTPRRVPLVLVSGGISLHELGTQCSQLHGPQCPELKRIARTREMAVMLAVLAQEPALQWWQGAYNLDTGVQMLVNKLPAWKSFFQTLGAKPTSVAEVAAELRSRSDGGAVAEAADRVLQKQSEERVAAAVAAGAAAGTFVSIGRGYCRGPQGGKTHYTYRCFPHCRGSDVMDLKTCEGLCVGACSALSHRQSDGRCVLYYGGDPSHCTCGVE